MTGPPPLPEPGTPVEQAIAAISAWLGSREGLAAALAADVMHALEQQREYDEDNPDAYHCQYERLRDRIGRYIGALPDEDDEPHDQAIRAAPVWLLSRPLRRSSLTHHGRALEIGGRGHPRNETPFLNPSLLSMSSTRVGSGPT